ncbi:porin family protein [Pedobacter sp. P351]|uniref:porin family protein n=1 Tax=Pedobacter superstes TaxID=3133441 RepID=UPI0030AAAF27
MRYIVILSSLLFGAFAGQSQEVEKNFKLGFTLSPNLSWVTNDGNNLAADGSKAGFSYGVLADIGFAKNYFFSTAFTVTALNSKAVRTGISADKYRLQFIEVPFTLKLKSNPTDQGRFYGQFGLGTGINISAKKDAESVGSNILVKDISISSDVNTFRLGLIMGAGAEWNAGKNLTILTGLSFNNGFTKVFKDYDSRNPFIALNLGVFF